MPLKPKKLRLPVGGMFAVAIAAGLYSGPAFAQVPQQVAPQQPPGGALNADNFYGKEPTEGVYVRDSAGAVEKLALAQKMEKLKEWNKSADLYQEVIVKYADRVVPSQLDKDKKIYQYTSITNPVQERLAHWPADGLEVYRARFETPAQTLLDAAKPGDAAALHKIYSLYFVTDAGKQAGIRLIDLYLENGEYPAAAWLGDRLLTLHPGLEVERAAVLYRTALAYYYAGETSKAKEHLAALKAHFPNDRGMVRGKDVVLADSLAQELQASVANSLSASADSWPVPFGDASRSRVSTAEGRPGARLYGVALSKPNWPSSPQQRDALQKQYDDMIEEGDTLGVMPVTDRGELYFQDGQRIYGLSIESGVPLPGWTQTYPNGAYTLPGVWGAARGHQLCVTLTEHEVLAIMGQPDPLAALAGMQVSGESRIVCLDRPTGREKWTVALSQLPDQAKEARLLQMSGSPLVVGDSVLITAHGNKAQFEDCYVLAFDLATGKFRWSTYIASASANAGNMMWQGMGNVARDVGENTSHLAYANGRVYVQTNLGALAALDAYTGAVVWLDIYPTGRQVAEQQFNRFMQQSQATAPSHKPWAYNPVMVSDGYVFTLPTEGNHLLIYDAATGIEIKRMDLKHIEQNSSVEGSSSSEFDILAGVKGDTMVLASERTLICLNWREYTDDTFNPKHDNITKWIESLAAPLRGRPFMSNDAIWVPCRNRLVSHSLKTGKGLVEYPVHVGTEENQWEAPEEPGNVLATNDYVVVAGAKMVNVYTDLTLAKAKLDKELALAPTDPKPRLRYAEVMFVAGQSEAAMGKLQEAINLLGGIKSLQTGANRDRLFNDTMNFADKIAKNPAPEDRARATALFDLAASAASSPAQQVQYRLHRAKFAEAGKDYAAAVALYQEILADPQLRPVPMASDASLTSLQAEGVAEKSIADIMKDRPAAYESLQQAAEAAMQQALALPDGKAAKLLEIARTYPNSTVASKAMIAAAEAFETAGDSRQAIRVLRDLWFKHSDGPERARIQESIARNYLALSAAPRESAADHGPMDNMEAAAAALARAAAIPGDPKLEKALNLRDGTTVDAGTPIAKALDVVRKYRGQEVSKALPAFGIPVPPPHISGQPHLPRPKPFLPEDKARDVIADVKALVVPIRDFSRADRLAVYTNQNALTILQAGEVKPLSTTRGLSDEPKNCAWVGKALLVWGGSSLANVKSDTGELAWKVDLREMPSIEVVRFADSAQLVAEAQPDPNMLVINGGQRVMIRNGQRVVFRPNGMRAAVVAPPAARQMVAGAAEEIIDVLPVGDHVLLTTTAGRILSVDLAGGKTAWQTRLSDHPVDRLVANEDFTAVRVSDDNAVRIAAFDTATGQLRCTKSWVVQSGIVPINLALAADGTLVYTMPDRLCLKDLYKPWPDASDKEIQANQGLPLFKNATQPDQLLIAEGRILALADDGSIKYVRVHSLETGQPVPLRYHSAQGEQDVDRILKAGKSEQVSLRVVGPHLYVINPFGVISYNLDHPAETWGTENDPSDPDFFPGFVRDSFIGQKFLALLCERSVLPAPVAPVPVIVPAPGGAIVPPNPPGQPAAGVQGNVKPPNAGGTVPDANGAAPLVGQLRLQLFRLTPISDKNPAESGNMDYLQTITDSVGITTQWQACDGGFYYLTADSKLHLLRGSKEGK
ncbi:MAG TPA: PQQ-binding-like beta-propeller repeat protein [Tepidisphaeraceae bacterium]|jgi:outer membrane protein assembly factor BamB|nr:PQQ-binding-like beta-propeller repeat protein [Tepidisphaeraceae bacterium]